MSALTEKFINERESKAARVNYLLFRRDESLRDIKKIDQELEVLQETISILDSRIHSHQILETETEVYR